MNNSSFVYNFISESNNAKIAYYTSQTDRSPATNILNNKIKVRKLLYFIIIEYLAFLFEYSSRNNYRHF